jgi:hypothetical protein
VKARPVAWAPGANCDDTTPRQRHLERALVTYANAIRGARS